MLSTEEMNSGNTSTQFLNKLWKIVNDPGTDKLIKWSPEGKTFIITNQTAFCQELVPKYFKHSNMPSFVRQLNMYGFRKVLSVESGGLTVEKGEIEFTHPNFIKGHQSLIEHIKRKPQTARAVVAHTEPALPTILSEVEKMKQNQELMGSKLGSIKKENDLLWREYANIRQKFSKQQQIIEKLVQFLVAMVKSPGQSINPKRKFNHLALEGVDDVDASAGLEDSPLELELGKRLPIGGPVIHEVTHLYEVQDQPVMDEVFHAPDASPETRFHHKTAGKRRKEPAVKREPISAADFDFVLAEDDNDSLMVPPQDSQPQPTSFANTDLTFATSEPPNAGNYTTETTSTPHFSSQFTTTNDSARGGVTALSLNGTALSPYGTVVSPNGTVLEPAGSLEDDLSPELLFTVNPNIVTTIPNKASNHASANQPMFSTNSSLLPNRSYGKNLGKMLGKQGGSKGNSRDLKPESSSGGPGKKKGKNISMGKKGANTNVVSNLNAAADESILGLPSVDVSCELAIPEKGDDLLNHVEEMQSSLDTIQDILSSGNVNIDTSAILSLFGNEDPYVPEQDPFANTSGNEVSLYNPSLYDMDDDDGVLGENPPLSSLLLSSTEDGGSSPSKRSRFSAKRESRGEEFDDDVLTTPRPDLTPFKFNS